MLTFPACPAEVVPAVFDPPQPICSSSHSSVLYVYHQRLCLITLTSVFDYIIVLPSVSFLVSVAILCLTFWKMKHVFLFSMSYIFLQSKDTAMLSKISWFLTKIFRKVKLWLYDWFVFFILFLLFLKIYKSPCIF